MLHFRSPAAVAAGLIYLASSLGAAATELPNDVARFLAGMQPAVDSPVAAYARDGNWQQHARYFDSAWDKLDKQQLSRVRAWSAQHLRDPQPTLFYTFSGPDFLYANAFFPRARTYVLAGLEPVGAIPTINERTRHSLANIRASLNTILNISYFITSDMSSKLRSGELKGTLPILYVFLARSGNTVNEVTLVALERDGTVAPADPRNFGRPNHGVKIEFTSKDGSPHTLYYFSTDLSNGGVASSGFLKFCEQLGTGDALVKSASYLLHGGNFSTVRDFLLAKSRSIVQDDTGIPVRMFKTSEWELNPFGAYLGPIEIFKGMYQPQLRDLFQKARAPKLDFGIGYRWRGHDSNLLLAVKKDLRAGPAN